MQKISNKTMDHGQIGRSKFFNIIKELTYSEEVLLGLVDYVQALLMSDSVELLQLMIDKFYIDDLQKELSSNLHSLTQFLKYTYNKHMIIEEDDCCTHGVEYSLQGETLATTSLQNLKCQLHVLNAGITRTSATKLKINY